MDKIARIRQEIERRKSLLTQHSKLTYDLILETFIKEYDDLLAFIGILSEEPSESLEEAAIDFADCARKQLFSKDYAVSSIADYDHGCIDGFKAGTEWQKEQMMKEAKDGYVSAIIIHSDGDEEHYAVTYPNGERPHSITDKVKIIIL